MQADGPNTGDPAVDRLIQDGVLIQASNPGGVEALLAIDPTPSSDPTDTAAILSELRADRPLC